MQKPEWGIFPDDREVKMFWGARGAIRKNYNGTSRLELYPDRQSFARDADAKKSKSDFVEWINNTLIPILEQRVKNGSTFHIELTSSDGCFGAVAEDRDSGGYLYIGAWEGNLIRRHWSAPDITAV